MALLKVLADIVCKTIFDPCVLERARRRKGAFTRNHGKLALPYDDEASASECEDDHLIRP